MVLLAKANQSILPKIHNITQSSFPNVPVYSKTWTRKESRPNTGLLEWRHIWWKSPFNLTGRTVCVWMICVFSLYWLFGLLYHFTLIFSFTYKTWTLRKLTVKMSNPWLAHRHSRRAQWWVISAQSDIGQVGRSSAKCRGYLTRIPTKITQHRRRFSGCKNPAFTTTARSLKKVTEIGIWESGNEQPLSYF